VSACLCVHVFHLIAKKTSTSTRTGRDPDNTVIVPEDPKPHLWTMTWKGIAWIANKFQERVRMKMQIQLYNSNHKRNWSKHAPINSVT